MEPQGTDASRSVLAQNRRASRLQRSSRCFRPASIRCIRSSNTSQSLLSALMIAGFDMEPDSDQVQQSRERNRKLLESRGKALHFVVSNLRLWGRELGVYPPLAYSRDLAAVALLFGARRVDIPSGFPYGFPTFDGSQPYLDLLWSNGQTQTSQTGAEADRTEKLRTISTDEDLMTALRVCSRSQNENCGKCVKCLRTMVTLRILGVQGPFPRMIDPVEIPRLKLNYYHELYFAIDNARFAASCGDATTLRAIKKAIRRYYSSWRSCSGIAGYWAAGLRRTRRRRNNYLATEPFVERPDLDL